VDTRRRRCGVGTGTGARLVRSLVAPIVARRFCDQRAFTAAVLAVNVVGFVGLLTTDVWPALGVMCVFAAPGASISLALLFMVWRSTSGRQTSQVSGMAQRVGHVAAAIGPVAIGALRDLTGSWTVAMTALALALVPQAAASALAGPDATMT
jgi:MFS transporter, CP family, cyanate transporter